MRGEIMLVGVVLFGIGAAVRAGWVALFGPRARARRRLAKGDTALTEGAVVTLHGTVERGEGLLEAPLSGRTCVLWEAAMEIRAPATPAYVEPDRYIRQAFAPFVLVTPTGRVHVRADYAELSIERYAIVPRKIDRERRFAEAVGRHASETRSAGFNELVIEEGARVSVCGVVVVEDAPSDATERGYRDAAPRRHVLVAHADHPLTIGK